MPLPESVALKLGKAREHMQAAKERADAFIGADPYAIGRDLEEDGRKHVHKFTRYEEPPPEIGLTVGDAIHNLRSSLDHLAFALANKGAASVGMAMTSKQETSIQFPIVRALDEFKDQVARNRLRYVDGEAIRAICLVQPFKRGSQFNIDYLWKIAELDNADKHRKLTTVGCVVHSEAPSLMSSVPEPSRTYHGGPWGLEAKVVTYVFPTPQPEVDMEANSTFSVALEEAWPPTWSLDKVLGEYIDYIENNVLRPLADVFL